MTTVFWTFDKSWAELYSATWITIIKIGAFHCHQYKNSSTPVLLLKEYKYTTATIMKNWIHRCNPYQTSCIPILPLKSKTQTCDQQVISPPLVHQLHHLLQTGDDCCCSGPVSRHGGREGGYCTLTTPNVCTHNSRPQTLKHKASGNGVREAVECGL